MKILSLFTGIGAFEKALQNIGINYELVGFSEIDKYAIQSYCAIHNEDERKNLGDITKIDAKLLSQVCSTIGTEIDMITHGSPCQDFSVAGKQAGGDMGTGTRSSLMWNTINIVTYIKPKYVIWENVKNLLGKKHKHNFDSYITIMESLGYNSYYQILNAKDYGVPQNRERIYTISIRKDIDKGDFKFPETEPLYLKLKDILEDKVDKKFYLSENQMNNFLKNNNGNCNSSGKNMNGQVYSGEIAPTITTNKGEGLKIKVNRIGGIFDTEKSKHQAGSIYDKNGLSPSIDTMQGGYRQPMIKVIENYLPSNHEASRIVDSNGLTLTVKENHGIVTATNVDYKIRKLTPKECWRLMGFSDDDFEKARLYCSNSQLYKQAGNSIVVPVLEKIFKNLLKVGEKSGHIQKKES